MKSSTILLNLLCILIWFSCKKPQSEDYETMFIIGEDPCTTDFALNKGFVVKLSHSQDTVVTYNPAGINSGTD